jgi:four helix bundle protein
MNAPDSPAAILQERMMSFSAGIIDLVSKLSQTRETRYVGNQLLRCGTAVTANYAEARGAESRSDFIHKLRIVLKELNETEVWLGLVARSSLLKPEKTRALVAENRELCRIIAKSIQTAGGFRR